MKMGKSGDVIIVNSIPYMFSHIAGFVCEIRHLSLSNKRNKKAEPIRFCSVNIMTVCSN